MKIKIKPKLKALRLPHPVPPLWNTYVINRPYRFTVKQLWTINSESPAKAELTAKSLCPGAVVVRVRAEKQYKKDVKEGKTLLVRTWHKNKPATDGGEINGVRVDVYGKPVKMKLAVKKRVTMWRRKS